MAIAGDLIGMRTEARMTRLRDTDLFYYSAELVPAARVNYHFIRDYQEILDPRNPRTTLTEAYGPEMEPTLSYGESYREVSWMSMPEWRSPAYLNEPPTDRRGRLVTHELESAVLGDRYNIRVYHPPSYDADGDVRYPVVYYHEGDDAIELGNVPRSLDNLIGQSVQPLIAVFIDRSARGAPPQYANLWANELVPFVDSTYRTIANREGRASIGSGFPAYAALFVAFQQPNLVAKAAALSPPGLVFSAPAALLRQVVPTTPVLPMELFLGWGRYDARLANQRVDLAAATRSFKSFLEARGYTVAGGEAPEGYGWPSAKHRTEEILTALFPTRQQ